MLQISELQLAELLSGIARAQAAVIHGIESALPGTRSNHIVPALQNVAHVRDHPDPTFVDLPVRALLAYMGRSGPDLNTLARELEHLTSEPDREVAPPVESLAPPTSDPAGRESRPSPDMTRSLDFSEAVAQREAKGKPGAG